MKQLAAPITSALEIVPETYLIWLKAPEIATEARPGQFIMVRCGNDTVLPRPFGVHRVDGDSLAILFAVVGKGTRWLSERKKGQSLDIFGPLGNGFTVRAEAKNLLLVAGGLGIAPLWFLAESAAATGKKVTVLTGARTAGRLVPVSPTPGLYNRGISPTDICAVTATDDGSEGFQGPVTGLVPAYLEGIDQVFACGPVEIYRSMAKIPELKNVPVQLSLEIMMGCGTGVCYGCSIKTDKGLKQVCKDGPVFEIEEIDFEKLW